MPSTLKWAVTSIPEFAIQPLPSGFISTRKNYSFQHWGWLVELCCSLNLFSMTNEIVEVPALFKTLSNVTNAIFSPHAVSARKSWWHHGWSCFFPSTYVTTLSSTAESYPGLSACFYSNIISAASAQLNPKVSQCCRGGESICECLSCPSPPIFELLLLQSLTPEALSPRFEQHLSFQYPLRGSE